MATSSWSSTVNDPAAAARLQARPCCSGRSIYLSATFRISSIELPIGELIAGRSRSWFEDFTIDRDVPKRA
jgi:hypothetical protein